MGNVSLKGVIDMHVHSNPDIRHRAYDDFQLMEAGIRVGARAIVIKTHQGTTVDRAYLCNRHNELVHHGDNDFTMFGSVTLNRQMGGINPAAVESGLKLGAKVIWMPTQSARNHQCQNHLDPSNCVDVIKDGHIVPELKSVFQLIKDFDVVLGTGHLSPDECFRVVEAARDAGIRKIVVTHPEWWLVGMSLEDQVRIVRDYQVILEHCFAQPLGGGKYKSNLPMNLEAIEACGYEHVMVCTDGGQVENPYWEIALEQYMQYLLDHGISESQLYHMTH
ncbi:MAG: DUF6282 family protein, partial [Lachnospiraceae bacterium]|nr:DUF6282 family protein [Lachnospiraceae bacterium]